MHNFIFVHCSYLRMIHLYIRIKYDSCYFGSLLGKRLSDFPKQLVNHRPWPCGNSHPQNNGWVQQRHTRNSAFFGEVCVHVPGMAFDTGRQNSRTQEQVLRKAAALLAGQLSSAQGKTLLLNAAASETKDDDRQPGASIQPAVWLSATSRLPTGAFPFRRISNPPLVPVSFIPFATASSNL